MSMQRSPQRKSSNVDREDVTNTVSSGTRSATNVLPQSSRVTPRNSIAVEAIEGASKETPHGDLRQLSNILSKPRTPLRQASSIGPPSTRRSVRRTPATQDRIPGGVPNPPSTRRPNAPTPHARAAVRGVELRRAAALTPRKDRRQSGRQQQRETPQNDLRALSKILAPSTKALKPSPPADTRSSGKALIVEQADDTDDGREPRPRLSIPLDEDEDDSMSVPILNSASLAEDENITQRSVERPRNIAVGRLGGRLSRGSLGSVRTSDPFGELMELGLDISAADGDGSSFIQQGGFEEYITSHADEDNTSNLSGQYLGDRIGQIFPTPTRTSDVRPEVIPEDESTFVLPLPQRNSLTGRLSVGDLDTHYDENEDLEDTRDQIMHDGDPSDSEIDQVEAAEDANMHDMEKIDVKRASIVRKIKKRIKISRHGIKYPSLPAGVVKRLSTTFLRTGGNSKVKLSKAMLDAIMQASDWFFEQVSDDLGTYAQHAGRKTIDENDVITLMKRQRQTSATVTPFALAQRYLPRELLQDLRMARPVKLRRARQLETVEEEDDDET